MAVKKRKQRKRRHDHYLRHNKKDDIPTLSHSLAPLEEIDQKVAQQHHSEKREDDTIVIDTGSLNLPQHLLEEQETENRILGLEPVVLGILILMLAFIAFITYQVYLMPAPTN